MWASHTKVLREAVSMTRWPLHCSCPRIRLSVFVSECLTLGCGETDRGTEACRWSPHIQSSFTLFLSVQWLFPQLDVHSVHASIQADDNHQANICFCFAFFCSFFIQNVLIFWIQTFWCMINDLKRRTNLDFSKISTRSWAVSESRLSGFGSPIFSWF